MVSCLFIALTTRRHVFKCRSQSLGQRLPICLLDNKPVRRDLAVNSIHHRRKYNPASISGRMLPFLKYHPGAKPGKLKRPAPADNFPDKVESGKQAPTPALPVPIASTATASPSPDPSPGPAKKPKNDRCFRDSWKSGRPWLSYDSDAGVMFCNLCIKHQAKTKNMAKIVSHTFITGCKNIKKSAIEDHGKSFAHQQAEAREKKDTEPVEKSTAGKALLALNSLSPSAVF